MKRHWLVWAIAAVSLGFTSAVEAATLFSPPLQSPAGGSLFCGAVNVSNQARAIFVALCDLGGTCANQDPAPDREPGQGRAQQLNSPATEVRYCKVTVDGGKDTVRAMLSVIDSSGTTTVSVGLE